MRTTNCCLNLFEKPVRHEQNEHPLQANWQKSTSSIASTRTFVFANFELAETATRYCTSE
jgi:hypothetical protein